MNYPQATILAKIAHHVKDIRHVAPHRFPFHGYSESPENLDGKELGRPYCFIGEGVLAGLISYDFGKYACYPDGFAQDFGVTEQEAKNFIYLRGYKHSPAFHPFYSGRKYYYAAKKLLNKYGYGDLI